MGHFDIPRGQPELSATSIPTCVQTLPPVLEPCYEEQEVQILSSKLSLTVLPVVMSRNVKYWALDYFIYIDYFFFVLFDDVVSTSNYESTVSNGQVFGE